MVGAPSAGSPRRGTSRVASTVALATQPNLLLVVFDTARLDAFEPYGAPAGSTPAVAQLAGSGSAHPRTYSTGCWTVPGHGSMFTGLLPRSAGLGQAGMDQFKEFPAVLEGIRDRLLAEVFTRAGYDTAGISTNAWVSSHTGFSTGFERFVQIRGHRPPGIGADTWRKRASWYLQALRARQDDGAREVEGLLDEWLAERSRRPFLWFVNLMECHSPYLPPKPFNRLNASGRLKAAQEAAEHLTLDNIWRCSCGGFDVPEPAIRRMRDLYADSIRQLDDWLARILELLDRRGVLADTQVVVTSDHGENLGDGAMLGHAFSLDDRLLRVPLVTSGPQSLPVDGMLSLSALPRILADLADLREHPWHDAPGAEDVAVAQFDAPGEGHDDRVETLVEQWGLGTEAARALSTSFTCATDGSLKLVRRLGREELFDLEDDPVERSPRLVGADEDQYYGARLAPLRAALDEAETGERRETAAPVAQEADAEETAKLEEQLRLLGYL